MANDKNLKNKIKKLLFTYFVLLLFLNKTNVFCKDVSEKEKNISLSKSIDQKLENIEVNKKKILVLYCSTGGGHKTCALAIKEYYEKKHKEITVEMVDVLENYSSEKNEKIIKLYNRFVNDFQNLYGFVYSIGNSYFPSLIVKKVERIMCGSIYNLINDSKPDSIVITHPFIAEALGNLKYEKKLKTPVICCTTDYNIHRVWVNKNIDIYITACFEAQQDVSKFGFNENKIFSLGIPVKQSFLEDANKKDLKAKFNLDQKKPVVFLMSGMNGCGNVEEIFKELLDFGENIQIIAICGTNDDLRFKLEKIKENSKKDFKIIIVGLTDKVSDYINASDVSVIKAGGMSITETLACNTPIAVFFALPGQEKKNSEFVVKNNLGIKLNQKNKGKQILSLLHDKEKINLIKTNQKKFFNKNVLKDLDDVIQKTLHSN
ncbi:MAG: hypothetical protein LBJ09_01025 [Clostridiales bacterium]|jgi:processive 1,2-diacylglycerol beta-glucosyltransferase|nr:hypothetical protein [Clostridiales bacterium]